MCQHRLHLVILALLLAAGAATIFRELGTASFYGDEAMYAQVAHESANGDWLPLHQRGEKFLHKPPLRILLSAALFQSFGESELVARIPDALLALGLIALVFWQGRRWFGPLPAALGTLLLLGAETLVFHHGLRDAVLTTSVVFLSTAMVLLWLRHLDTGDRLPLVLVALCAMTLGLVKQPTSVFFAGLLVILSFAEAAVSRRWDLARGGIWLVMLAGVVGWFTWFTYMETNTHGYYTKFLYWNFVQRATTGVDPTHVRPATFYAWLLWHDFGGWLLLAFPAAWGAWRHVRARGGDPADRARFHLAAWSGVMIVAFCMPASKNTWYIYPAFPTLGLFLTSGMPVVSEWLRRHARHLAPVFVVALAALATLNVTRSWVRAGRDVLVLDAERFGRAYRRLDRPELYVDLDGILKRGPFRSWNWYYLTGLPGVQVESKVDADKLPTGHCVFVVTAEPAPYRDRGWQWEMSIHRIDPREAPLSIVGTCALKLDAAGDAR